MYKRWADIYPANRNATSEAIVTIDYTKLGSLTPAYVFFAPDAVPFKILQYNSLPFPLSPGGFHHGFMVPEIRNVYEHQDTLFGRIWSVSGSHRLGKSSDYYPSNC